MDDLIQTFSHIRDISYKIPLSLEGPSFNCAGKHITLKKKIEELGFECRFRVCSFRWSDLDLPAKITNIPHEDASTHVYLETLVDDDWKVVDVTWDSALMSKFHINEWENEQEIAVPPVEIYSPEKSAEIMSNRSKQAIEVDLKINGKFYKAINNWLEKIRTV